MKNEVYLLTYSSKEEFNQTGTIKIPMESLITYCVHKYCQSEEVKLKFVHTANNVDKALLNLNCECIEFIDYCEIPWQVSSCVYPTVFYNSTIITGLCAVSRHICRYRSSPQSPQEAEEGLLGFRKGCLQAPNEVSIWTKFCEIDLLNSVKDLLLGERNVKVPKSLVKFENHLKKPVRIHNVYKIARELKKETITSINKDTLINIVSKDSNSLNDQRMPKNRKWKSNVKKELEVDCCVKIEDLNVTHKFAEGPFFTLADLVLFAPYNIVMKSFGENVIESLLPLTFKWFSNTKSMKELGNVNYLFQTIDVKPLSIENMELPHTEDVSLYKSDPKRLNPKKRLFTKPEDIENALNVLEEGMELGLSNFSIDKSFDWNVIPDGANPAAGHLPDERVIRKSKQLENLCLAVLSMAKEGDHIVDFCCGSGHLGILIAYLLPKCTVILLENKEQSLSRGKERVQQMGLQNVYFFQCNLDFFIGKFDIGIALHACGIASDLVLDKCLEANAKFVICPCCYGSLHATDRLVYPRSSVFKNLSIDQYLCIGHTADQTHQEHPLSVRGARCMAIIDSDRARLAQKFGYKVTLSRLKPLSCTPKNNLLIGVPS
ncbi:glutathione S-transferase C-terminal domain-containing protein homolog [Maniola jurtina]|uniref:glutathione S-transferase C-terminal domain-containing protein homolog n=1 Tax=Maniola jurtina TaxID=191418 RepID=UPI001E68E214|nr:glutathione S-transferase C-terminal domain-containing protein homolog [Maniola jurtina]